MTCLTRFSFNLAPKNATFVIIVTERTFETCVNNKLSARTFLKRKKPRILAVSGKYRVLEDAMPINEPEKIDRLEEDYQKLVRAGLFAASFQGHYRMPREPWEMEFIMLREMTTDSAKHAAAEFLSNRYEATAIQFFKAGAAKNRFIARFMRGDC